MNQKILLVFLATLISLPLKAQITSQNFLNKNAGSTPSDPTSRKLQSCEPGCLDCPSSEVCLNCDSTRVLIDGKCRCESPRILISNNCECPWYMAENPATQDCEYIDLLDVAYHPHISPLFDAVFQVQMNPRLKWTTPPTFTWTVNCNYQDTPMQDQLSTYLSMQQNDFLLILIPSALLEHNLKCDVRVSYNNQNNIEISKSFAFTTLSYFQPQV